MSTTKRTRRPSKSAKRTDWTKELPLDAATIHSLSFDHERGGQLGGYFVPGIGRYPGKGEAFDLSVIWPNIGIPSRCVVTGVNHDPFCVGFTGHTIPRAK